MESPLRTPLRSQLTSMAAITLLGMPLLGWVIARFVDDMNLMVRWTGAAPIWKQLLYGLPVGVVAALMARFIVGRKFMDGVRLRYERMFRNLRLNWSEIAFISLCAGVGEELLFRGVLQPLLGIVLTAVLFVAIHGYLNPRDWRISVYGVFMTGVICFLGWMTEVYGIWSAVMAHFVIDVILLADLLEKPNETPNLSATDDVFDDSDRL
ncbi:MAG: CPBP family intramembrane glutamic endopeptidase [Flavobacteriales bacterium]